MLNLFLSLAIAAAPLSPGVNLGKSCIGRCGEVIPSGSGGSPGGSNWCNSCACENGQFTVCTLQFCLAPEPPCPVEEPKSCTGRCGEVIPSGSGGSPGGSNWCNSCACENGEFTACTLKLCVDPEPVCPGEEPKGCTGRCGEVIPSGSGGSPGGNNWCNTCACENGQFTVCTLQFCDTPEPPCPGEEPKSCTGRCGEVIPSGSGGSPGGDNWCNSCACENGQFTACTLKLCVDPEPSCPGEEPKSCTGRCGEVIPSGSGGSPGGSNWCNSCACENGRFTVCTLQFCVTPEPPCPGEEPKKDCKTQCNNTIKHGETASDDGTNFCNECTCDDGQLACTEKGCPAPPKPTCLAKNSICAVKKRRNNKFTVDRRTECPDNTSCKEVSRNKRRIRFKCVEN